ncbi:hypothetical protein Scep_022967 [Stephania cephalantha]|uniref:RPA-interacting protein n=1 Tax=Stephania cephalantha TaxID=152367 RepID=A0AAP0HYA2_9MAGN
MEEQRPRRRPSMKAHQSNWKAKLRQNCLKRVQEDRTRLTWKMRLSVQSPDRKEMMESTMRDIVSDELKKMKSSAMSTSIDQDDDVLWEYDGIHVNLQSPETECEDLMIEMQRIFYEDLRREKGFIEEEDYDGIWDGGEEDELLAQELFEHVQLNNEQVGMQVIWCPICKRGKLQEDLHLIYCSCCKLQLTRGDEVSLELLQVRLGEAFSEHLDRGCRKTPKFHLETSFNLKALYINCEACDTLEIVL